MVFSRLFQCLHTYSTWFRPFSLWHNPIWPICIGQISGVVDYHYGNQYPLRCSSSARLQCISKETKVPLPKLHLGSHLSSSKLREQHLSSEYLWGLHFLETWSHSTNNFLHPITFWSFIYCALIKSYKVIFYFSMALMHVDIRLAYFANANCKFCHEQISKVVQMIRTSTWK